MADTSIPEPEGPVTPIETEYEIGQHNIQPKLGPFGLDIHNPVFAISGLTIIAFVILTLALQDQTAEWFPALRSALTETFDWFFLTADNIFVILCLALIVSPLGFRLAGDRHDHGRRQGQRAAAATRVLGHLRGLGRDRPAARRGLAALQAASVSTGFPSAIVLLLACFSIVKGLMAEPR